MVIHSSKISYIDTIIENVKKVPEFIWIVTIVYVTSVIASKFIG